MSLMSSVTVIIVMVLVLVAVIAAEVKALIVIWVAVLSKIMVTEA